MADQQRGAKVRQTDIPVSTGQPTPAEAKRWLGQQVVYQNFAGRYQPLDELVQRFVYQHRERFHARMAPVMERWETIWDAANGDPVWGEYDDDIHVPETKKKLDAKVARIEEAIFGFDPIFEVEGTRGDLPQWKAQIISSYVYRTMEIAGYQEMVQPLARDGEICNLQAIKLHWDVRYGQVVDRSWEMKERPDGTPYYHDERRVRDAVTKMGVKYSMVDPFLLLYDIDCGDLNSDDCAFVGDESDQFLHDLESMAKSGLFSEKQVQMVRDRKAGTTAQQTSSDTTGDFVNQHRLSRSIAQGPQFSQHQASENDPRRVRCIEIWGWFDFGDEGYDGVVDPLGKRITGTHKVVITCAQGVVLQFRLNPFDKKMHPYAIGRINRNGHEAVAPSPFEQVIQANAQYDRYQSNVLRASDLSVAPLLRTAGSFPTGSLLGVKPGTVFRDVPQEVQEIRIGDVPQSVSYFHQYFRREMEETSGALNVFESPQGTATETERKVQEQQRMVANSIRANGDLWRQVAMKTLWMCAQFSTAPQRFAIVGKASEVLGKSFEITPDQMQEEVEFRFLGIKSLHVLGNRIQGMAQWMGRWGPLLPQMPEINLKALIRQDYELSVGRHNVMDIFPNSEPAWSSWPQKQENEMLMAGRSVPISEQDDHQQHLDDLEQLIRSIEKLPKYAQSGVLEHYSSHLTALQKQKAEEKAKMQKSMLEQQLMGGTPGRDRPPADGGMEAVTKAQTPGITPGPPQARTVPKTGRSGSGMSQTQAMSA